MSVKTRGLLHTLAFLLYVALALFVPAGRIDIGEFWAYLAILAAIAVLSFLVLDEDLMAERMRPGGQRVAARFLPGIAIMILHWAVAGWDRRLSIGAPDSLAWRIAGLAAFATGLLLFLWAMQVNRYFSSIPRLQAERGHRVIEAGPYAWLRHPGYAGALIAAIASPVALGSWWSSFCVPVALFFMAWRIAREESLLTRELPGYADYARRVRFRLVPGLW